SGGYRRGRRDVVVEPASLVPGQHEQRPWRLRSLGEGVEDRGGEGLADLVVLELTLGREGDVRGDEAHGREPARFAVFEELGDQVKVLVVAEGVAGPQRHLGNL